MTVLTLLRHGLQNLIMAVPAVRRSLSRWHTTGLDRDPRRVAEAFARLTAVAPVGGRDLLEIGPGQTPDLLLRARAEGARRCAAVDVMPYLRDESIEGVEYSLYDGVDLPFDDASFDLVWSTDVFQHFRRPDATVAEIYRVLRPGGRLVARVDLRDLHHLDREEAWLDFLRYSELRWRAMVWFRSSYSNRLRMSEWIDVFARAGFEVVSLEQFRSEVLRRRGNDSSWRRRVRPDDLTIYRYDIACAKGSARR